MPITEGMNGINYGGFVFTNPVPLAFALLPRDPGLFTIQVRNMSFGPLPYQPIHFGASPMLAAERFVEYEEHARWRRHPLAWSGLFVSTFPLRYEAAGYREEAASELIRRYLTLDGEARKRAQQQAMAARERDAVRRNGDDGHTQ